MSAAVQLTAREQRIAERMRAMLPPTQRAIYDEIARLRTADGAIGWTVERGLFTLVRTVPSAKRRGRVDVEKLSAPMPADAFLVFVRGR